MKKNKVLVFFLLTTNTALVACSVDFGLSGSNHIHDWSNPYYSWSDDYCTCSAIRICELDKRHVEEETAVCSFEVSSRSDLGSNKLCYYTAAFNNPAFENQTQSIIYDPMEERKSTGIVPSEEDVKNATIYSHIVIFGIDGAGSYFEKTDTPYFDSIFSNGSINYNGISQLPTMSAENWESMFTGVCSSTHGINNNIAKTTPKDDNYPTIFKTCSEIYKGASFYSAVNWHPINDGLIENNINNLTKDNVEVSTSIFKDVEIQKDKKVAQNAADRINNCSDLITFVHFDYVDSMCHKYGNASSYYFNAIKEMDLCIKTIYDSYEKNNMLDDTLFIAVSDHGSIGTKNHGGESISERKAMLAVSDKKGEVIKGTTEKYVTHDLASIVLYALGIKQPAYYEGGVPRNLFKKLG